MILDVTPKNKFGLSTRGKMSFFHELWDGGTPKLSGIRFLGVSAATIP